VVGVGLSAVVEQPPVAASDCSCRLLLSPVAILHDDNQPNAFRNCHRAVRNTPRLQLRRPPSAACLHRLGCNSAALPPPPASTTARWVRTGASAALEQLLPAKLTEYSANSLSPVGRV
jgi:hypothetical protein